MAKPTPDLWWVDPLLDIIPFRMTIKDALEEVGVSKQRVHQHIQRNSEFRKRYYDAKSIQQQRLSRILGVAKQEKENLRAQGQLIQRKEEEDKLREFREAMDLCDGNILKASSLCRVSRATIYRRVESHPAWKNIYYRYKEE